MELKHSFILQRRKFKPRKLYEVICLVYIPVTGVPNPFLFNHNILLKLVQGKFGPEGYLHDLP